MLQAMLCRLQGITDKMLNAAIGISVKHTQWFTPLKLRVGGQAKTYLSMNQGLIASQDKDSINLDKQVAI